MVGRGCHSNTAALAVPIPSKPHYWQLLAHPAPQLI
jgi:hypothetical protein